MKPRRPIAPGWLYPTFGLLLASIIAAAGQRTRSLGVEHFGQTGSIADLYRHYRIDSNAIVAAVESVTLGRPIRHLQALP